MSWGVGGGVELYSGVWSGGMEGEVVVVCSGVVVVVGGAVGVAVVWRIRSVVRGSKESKSCKYSLGTFLFALRVSAKKGVVDDGCPERKTGQGGGSKRRFLEKNESELQCSL